MSFGARNREAAGVLAAAAIVVCVAGPAFAQAGGEAGPIALDQIDVEGQGRGGSTESVADQGLAPNTAVTGAKSDTPVNEIPQTINVITREELDIRGVEDFNQALAYTPAVRVTDYPGGQGGPTIYIRGFQSINQEGLYQDGLRAGFNGYDERFDVFPYERIDILKGPASVLYGRAQPGGIVSLTTKRPTEKPFGEIELQGGSFDRRQGTIDVGGPLDDEGKFLYRISGLIRDADTQVDFTRDNRRYIAPSFTWKPDDQTSFTLLSSYSWSKAGGSEQSLPAIGTLSANGNGRIPRGTFLGEPGFNREELEGWQIGGILEHRFNDVVSFHSVTRAEFTDSKYDTMLSGFGGILYDKTDGKCEAYIPGGSTTSDKSSCYDRFAQWRRQDSRSFLTDNNLLWRFETGPVRHKLLTGVDFWDYDRDEQRQNGPDSGIDVFNPRYGAAVGPFTPFFDVDAKLRQTGLYARDEMKLDRWILTLGIRHDWAAVDTKTTYYQPALDVVPVDTLAKKTSYQAALGYEFESGVTPYASYSTAFNPQPVAKVDKSPFDPTTSDQYEAGVKYQPKGYDAYVTAAAFQITQQNVPTPNIAAQGFFDQTGEVRVRGFEIEGKAKLTNGLSVLAAYTYLDTEVTKDKGIPAFGIESKKGNRLQNVPKHQASLWLDYAMQPGGALEGLRFGGGARFMGRTTDANNVLKVKDYTLFDASASYDLGKAAPRLKGFTVKVEAQNLTDKRYFTPGFYADAVFEGYRRQVLASVSYRW